MINVFAVFTGKLLQTLQNSSYLLFMDDLKLYGSGERQIDSLINTVRVFSYDIRMVFGMKKCGVVVMKRGKVVEYDGVGSITSRCFGK